jgi:hypothetical protein
MLFCRDLWRQCCRESDNASLLENQMLKPIGNPIGYLVGTPIGLFIVGCVRNHIDIKVGSPVANCIGNPTGKFTRIL